jgi:hypothetical protein
LLRRGIAAVALLAGMMLDCDPWRLAPARAKISFAGTNGGERMSAWLRPILGAALALAVAAGLVYKVISGYQHASPDAFISVRDQNRLIAASAVDHPTQAATVPVDVAAPAQTAPTAPPAASEDTLAIASRAVSNVVLPAESLDNPACVPIKAEQREIEGGLKKQYSPEQGRFMQRRLRELAQQSINLSCTA